MSADNVMKDWAAKNKGRQIVIYGVYKKQPWLEGCPKQLISTWIDKSDAVQYANSAGMTTLDNNLISVEKVFLYI